MIKSAVCAFQKGWTLHTRDCVSKSRLRNATWRVCVTPHACLGQFSGCARNGRGRFSSSGRARCAVRRPVGVRCRKARPAALVPARPHEAANALRGTLPASYPSARISTLPLQRLWNLLLASSIPPDRPAAPFAGSPETRPRLVRPARLDLTASLPPPIKVQLVRLQQPEKPHINLSCPRLSPEPRYAAVIRPLRSARSSRNPLARSVDARVGGQATPA